MIVRMWRGTVPMAKKAAYIDYVNRTGMTEYRATAGNRGAYMLCRELGETVEFLTLTFWDDLEAIKRFAGHEYLRARYYPEDAEYLEEFAPFVEQFEVAEARA